MLFFRLLSDLGSIRVCGIPVSSWFYRFWRAGNYNRSNGSVINRTTNGNWWSRNASSDQNANNLNTNISSSTGNVNAQNSNYRGNGFSVRCVAR